MAGADRMTIEEVVRNVLLDKHADVIREALKAVAAEMMELVEIFEHHCREVAAEEGVSIRNRKCASKSGAPRSCGVRWT